MACRAFHRLLFPRIVRLLGLVFVLTSFHRISMERSGSLGNRMVPGSTSPSPTSKSRSTTLFAPYARTKSCRVVCALIEPSLPSARISHGSDATFPETGRARSNMNAATTNRSRKAVIFALFPNDQGKTCTPPSAIALGLTSRLLYRASAEIPGSQQSWRNVLFSQVNPCWCSGPAGRAVGPSFVRPR